MNINRFRLKAGLRTNGAALNLPNLLATRFGRLTALFFLYASKGIPYGFTSLAIVNEMSTQGLSKEVIGWYFSSLTWPWAIKWMFGPAVDLFYSKRLGHRRTWLLLTQVVMAATLLVAGGSISRCMSACSSL